MKQKALKTLKKAWVVLRDPQAILKGAIALFIGSAIAVFSLDLAAAITAFICGGLAGSFLLKRLPACHDLPKIVVSVGAGALAGLICVFVAELSVLGCSWLVWDFLSTFQENLRCAVV